MKKYFNHHIIPFINRVLDLRISNILVLAVRISFVYIVIISLIFYQEVWFYDSKLFSFLRTVSIIQTSYKWIGIIGALVFIAFVVLYATEYFKNLYDNGELKSHIIFIFVIVFGFICSMIIGFFIGYKISGKINFELGIIYGIISYFLLLILINKAQDYF